MQRSQGEGDEWTLEHGCLYPEFPQKVQRAAPMGLRPRGRPFPFQQEDLSHRPSNLSLHSAASPSSNHGVFGSGCPTPTG